MTSERRHSLRGRLLAFILIAVVCTAALQMLIAYRNALHETDEIFDYQMLQIGSALRGGPPRASDARSAIEGIDDENFSFVIQVFEADGSRSFQSSHYVDLLQRAEPGFSMIEVPGTRFRVFAIESGSQLIQISQDIAARELMARNLAFWTVGPVGLMVPLLIFAVWWVVSKSLAPVRRLRKQLAERSAGEVSSLNTEGLPREISPLVQEMNSLFTRVCDAFQAQRNFVADAAHELRSPLSALKLQIKGLRRARDPRDMELALNRAEAGVDRATRVVEQLLVLARQQAALDRQRLDEPIRLHDLVQASFAELVPLFDEKQLHFELQESEGAYVLGNPAQLGILVRNLLDNAIKYNIEHGRVSVSITRAQGLVTLVVEDSGPGIPDKDMERVFDRFYRVPGTQSAGSGLGLSIVSEIAKTHSANVRLTCSEALGGLRVSIEFQV